MSRFTVRREDVILCRHYRYPELSQSIGVR
jgi:hypothetical protein